MLAREDWIRKVDRLRNRREEQWRFPRPLLVESNHAFDPPEYLIAPRSNAVGKSIRERIKHFGKQFLGTPKNHARVQCLPLRAYHAFGNVTFDGIQRPDLQGCSGGQAIKCELQDR